MNQCATVRLTISHQINFNQMGKKMPEYDWRQGCPIRYYINISFPLNPSARTANRQVGFLFSPDDDLSATHTHPTHTHPTLYTYLIPLPVQHTVPIGCARMGGSYELSIFSLASTPLCFSSSKSSSLEPSGDLSTRSITTLSCAPLSSMGLV